MRFSVNYSPLHTIYGKENSPDATFAPSEIGYRIGLPVLSSVGLDFETT
jgi:hypothetical protein